MKSEPTSDPPSSPNTANDSGARLVGAAEQDFNSQVGKILEFERPFRAVLVADVVSYTRLMEAAEVETHSRYRALRVSVIDPALIGRRGEIVKNTGDGFVAVFESPLDALRCASELQREVTGLETLQPPERRIAFRIGVHWEPVIFDLNDVYGHGVNIAARLQSVAPAGGVVVSSALLRVVADLSEFKFDDLGELHLKNLSRPVHAFLLLSPGVDRRTVIGASTKSSRRTKLPSIAVLPFANSSSEVDDSYFAEGFVEDIIVSLSNIQELLVVSRGSTMPFRQREIDPVEIGEKLGVRYYVSGHVRRSGKRFRFSVELVDVATGSVVWAEKYDTDLADVFEVQDEIAIGVVEKIAAYVRRAEIKRALRKPPKSLNAYDYLLRALELLYKFDFASFSRAKGLLEKASEEDPEYAAPYAFAAKWHNFQDRGGVVVGFRCGFGRRDPAVQLCHRKRPAKCSRARDTGARQEHVLS
ncbi:TolB-like protein/class 3 adenylate cyclase [Bradyrhizobium sp. i1.3.6]